MPGAERTSLASEEVVPPTSPDLAAFLASCQPVWEQVAVYPGGGSAVVRCLVTAAPPPMEYVTSVRALVFRGGVQSQPLELLVLRSSRSGLHLLPGGQREPGESFEQTMERELAEETGWTAGRRRIAGVIHVRQLGPHRPHAGYAHFPYPDWLNVIYAVEAGELAPGLKNPDDVEAEAFFMPADQIDIDALGEPHEPSWGFLTALRAGTLVLRH